MNTRTSVNAYIERLMQLQADRGWSDREMGRQLGLGKSTWPRIKSGERGMTTFFLSRAMARFPEFNAIAFIFLSQNASSGGIIVSQEEHVA